MPAQHSPRGSHLFPNALMSDSSFYRLGRLAGAKARKVQWMWSSLTGNDEAAIRAEYGVGREMAAVVQSRSGIEADPALQQLLDDTRQRLAAVVRNKQHRFSVAMLGDDQPTAYALPGGFIFVTKALTDLCERDADELAFVIAHEMSHVIRRHAINRVLRQAAFAAASMAAPGRGTIGPWLRKVGVEWLERAYSHEQEFEADDLGVLLSRAAGFEIAGAVRLFERLRSLDVGADTSGVSTYLSTHPPVTERIERLQRNASRPAS
jgi:predicted Zn-dependent protease